MREVLDSIHFRAVATISSSEREGRLRSNSDARLESATSTGESPGRRVHRRFFRGTPVTFSISESISRTQQPLLVPKSIPLTRFHDKTVMFFGQWSGGHVFAGTIVLVRN